jgi:4-carboxymuconolactone decarboxylase
MGRRRSAHLKGREILPRIPLFPTDTMTAEQHRVHDAVVSGPRGELRGPLRAALYRPELADKWQQFGELLRYRTSLPAKWSELAILVTGRSCHSQLEWHIHAQMAEKAGLPADVIEEIRLGRRPKGLDEEGLAIYDYADELNRRKTVGEATYRRVLARWDAIGVVELTALIGYYTMVAMTLNCHDIPLPDGVAPPLPPAP